MLIHESNRSYMGIDLSERGAIALQTSVTWDTETVKQ
jgi:hypothetical protein